MPEKSQSLREVGIEEHATLKRDGFEVVDIPIKGPWLLPDGTLRVDLRPSTNITRNRLYLVYDPERADVWEGTIPGTKARELQAKFFANDGFTPLETQFSRHVVAVRTKPPETPKPTAS